MSVWGNVQYVEIISIYTQKKETFWRKIKEKYRNVQHLNTDYIGDLINNTCTYSESQAAKD